MSLRLRIKVRIDDADTNEIHRFQNQQCPVVADEGTGKLYQIKFVDGTLAQQEVTITDKKLVEIGPLIKYVKE